MITELLTSSFKIKRISSSGERDFINALKIYNNTIPVEIKTDTNEITYFVDLKNESGRQMFFFCLYYNETVIGYIESAYLKQTKTIIIDYIAMDNEYRINGIFYPLFSLFQQFFSENLIDYDYIVSEVSLRSIEEHVDDESYYNRTLLKLEDFRLLDITYPQPKLGTSNLESNFNMGLMIKTKHPIIELKKETVINIINNIYYDHYYDWYKTFMGEKEINLYLQHLNSLLSGISDEVKNKSYIPIKDSVAETCEHYLSHECYYRNSMSTAGFKSIKNKKKRIAWALILPLILVGSMFLSYAIYFVFKQFNIPNEHIAPVVSSTASLVIGILTLALTSRKSKP